MRLWYQSPAEDWNSALPLGNGKLGAMVFGGPVAERIQLNEDSVWSGGFRDRVNPDCKNNLPEIRRLLREGDIAQAENLATLAMAGTPEFERMYQTLGDIYLTMENQAGEVKHYTRQLDLDNALCTVSYTSGGVDYTREVYISAPHNVMVVRLGSSRKGGVSFQVRMHRGRYTDGTFQDKEQNAIYYTGGEGIRFCSMLRASAVGGTVEVVGEYLVVKNADQATLTWTAATTYRVEDPVEECRRVLDAASLPERELWQAHLQDYQTLYNRARLTLAADSALEVLPTDARLARVQNGEEDLGAGGPVLRLWPLPDHRLQQAGLSALQPPGRVERPASACLGQQVHHQYQHGDELLAGGGVQPLPVPLALLRFAGAHVPPWPRGGPEDVRRPGLCGPPQHRFVGGLRAPGQLHLLHLLDDGRRLDVHPYLGAVRVHLG